MKVVLNNIALVIRKCDEDQCAWHRMCVNITYSLNCCSILFRPKCMITILFHCITNRMQRVCYARGVTTAAHNVTLNSSGF